MPPAPSQFKQRAAKALALGGAEGLTLGEMERRAVKLVAERLQLSPRYATTAFYVFRH